MKLLHAAAPAETRTAMTKLSNALDQCPAPAKQGRPLRWTKEWRAALVIFVERQVFGETNKRFLAAKVGAREIDAIRTNALKASLKRQFPFRRRTIPAARQQFHLAKKQLSEISRPGESLTWIYTALDLEATYQMFSHLGDEYSTRITVIRPEYRAMPDWIWVKLAKDGRILMPDVPKIN